MNALKLKYIRQSVGIFLVTMGSPLIFFFKEFLGFGGSSVFTIAGLALGCALLISEDTFKVWYKPNIVTFRLAAYFTVLSYAYMYYFNPTYWMPSLMFRETGNYLFIIGFFVLLLGVSSDIKKEFLPVVSILTFFGSICLIYSMATNPFFIIGQRATVVFGDGSTSASGNPHVYARNAFAAIFSSYLLLKDSNLRWKLFCLGNIFLSLIVLMLTQARSTLLAFFFALAIFLFYNARRMNVGKAIRSFFSAQNIVILVSLFAIIIAVFVIKGNLIDIIYSYYENASTTFVKALLTAAGLAGEKEVDASAMGRVGNFAYFSDLLAEEPWLIFLGKGYRFFYLDIPLLESLLDYGIMGFFSFGMMNWIFFKDSLRTIRDNKNTMNIFFCYLFFTYFVGIFTGGRPNDTPYWFVYAFLIRFVGLEYLKTYKKNEEPSSLAENSES